LRKAEARTRLSGLDTESSLQEHLFGAPKYAQARVDHQDAAPAFVRPPILDFRVPKSILQVWKRAKCGQGRWLGNNAIIDAAT
jgi:hypothetical protein